MRLTSSILALSFALSFAACEREPAIVVRFDPRDLAGHDAGKSADASLPRTLANEDAGQRVDKLAIGPACKAEADCTLVPSGCCDCANGSQLLPARRRDEAKLVKAKHAACKDTMCTMMVSTDKLCGWRPACVDGHCAARHARPDEEKPSVKLPE
jgi:hypothetical protein